MNTFLENELAVEINAAKVTAAIMHLFETHGNREQDGVFLSHTAHMIQCAMLALRDGAGPEMVLGAFLHDIGHLLKREPRAGLMGPYSLVDHDELGARYLAERGFSEKICALVELHVQAKRYLVATNADYAKKLSEASWQTLQWQGGPMTAAELQEFRQHPYFKEAIKVRYWDEEARDGQARLLPLSLFGNLIFNFLSSRIP
ncbi:HDIG domain-containing metalloprotein [Paraflavisolibacter sp. H34]|uniref:HD domain-containing protein n=1 Tax=Huijunlia imazamoxiresistens TaxID=3127457 RepID=UPI003017B08D